LATLPSYWSVWAVTAIVLLAYSLSVGVALRHRSPEEFIHLGRVLVNKSQASPAISSRVASYHYDGEIGFDGQYAYFLAVDPINARFYMDSPAYRYTRVLYPLTARVLALGRADLVPWTLILVNLAMIGVGTAALAAWLRRHGASAWYAAVYGFYPGVLITLTRDTTEVMAYGLVAVAVYLFDRRGPNPALPQRGREMVGAAIVFALAVLTRETAAIFAIGYALAILATPTPTLPRERGREILRRLQQNWRRALLFVAIWAVPIALWKIFLRLWLGSFGFDAHIERVPFAGIAAWYPWNAGQVDEVRIVVIPAVLCGIVAVWAIIRGMRRVETWLLVANVVILVVLLESPAYNDISSSGRITIGVVLATMLCIPYLALRRRVFIWAAAVLWLTPMLIWFAIPTARAVLSTIKHSVLG
jgi:hypothetical protein